MTRQEIFVKHRCATMGCSQECYEEDRYCNFCRPEVSARMFELLGKAKTTTLSEVKNGRNN